MVMSSFWTVRANAAGLFTMFNDLYPIHLLSQVPKHLKIRAKGALVEPTNGGRSSVSFLFRSDHNFHAHV